MKRAIAKVLTRVAISQVNGAQPLQRLKANVASVLHVAADALNAVSPEAGCGLFIEEIAKRAHKRKRSTQTAVCQALGLGFIRREHQRTGAAGTRKPLRYFLHPLLLAEARRPNPHKGPDLIFPRDWADTSLPASGSTVAGNVPAPPSNKSARHASPVKFDVPAASVEASAYFRWLVSGCRHLGLSPSVQILAQRRKQDGARGGTFTPPGLADAVDAEQLESAALCALAGAAQAGLELTFRLRDLDHPVLLVDDVMSSSLAALPWPGAVVETSPGNLQVTLIADRAMSPQHRLFAQRALRGLLHGDPGSVGANQLRRFPGSINSKPQLDQPFVARLLAPLPSWAATAGAVEKLIEQGRLMEHPQRAKASWVEQEMVVGPNSSVDQSDVDFGWAMHQLTSKKGRSDEEVVSELEFKAAARRRHQKPANHPSHRAYAERTVKAARKRLTESKRP